MPPSEPGSARILRGNALALPLPDECVDLVVTSPPYFGLRSYQDGGQHYAGQIGDEATPGEFVDALISATREMVRVLKPTGSVWVNLGDKYVSDNRGSGYSEKRKEAKYAPPGDRGYVGRDVAPRKSLIGIPWRYVLRCIDDLGLILRAEVIWSKPNGLPESATDRVARKHETWFHFTREPRYFAAVDELREDHTCPRDRGKTSARFKEGTGRNDADVMRRQRNPLGKLPGSVWSIPTQALRVPDHLGVDHFAAFPMEWPRRIIGGWCPPSGVVLDPFGGTGTTALVAKAMGRTGISVDMSADYCRLAQWRTTDPDQIAAALQVDKPPRQATGQLDMFGEESA